jgi:hypothetical protein
MQLGWTVPLLYIPEIPPNYLIILFKRQWMMSILCNLMYFKTCRQSMSNQSARNQEKCSTAYTKVQSIQANWHS